MNRLAAFLAAYLAKGADVFSLTAPSGLELAGGPMGDSENIPKLAEELEELARHDAVPLPQERQHEYRIHVRAHDNSARGMYPIRVSGGTKSDGDHHVDPERVTTANSAVGHLVRLLADERKENTKLVGKFVELCETAFKRDTEYTRELERTNRRNLALKNEPLKLRVVELEAEERRAERERNAGILSEIFGLAGPVLRNVPLLGPALAENSLGKLRESFTDEQHAKFLEVLGQARYAKLLTIPKPDKLVAWLCAEVRPEELQAMMALLDEQQQQAIQGALAAEMQKHNEKLEADKKKQAAANGTASKPEGGAPPS